MNALLIFYGVLLTIGLVQFVGFLIRLSKSKDKPKKYKTGLKIYGILVVLYCVALIAISYLEMNDHIVLPDYFNNLYFVVIPIFLIVYYWMTVYRKYK